MSEKRIDQELVNQVLRGDKEAFNILVLKYQKKIANVITPIVKDNATVLDITQETFINAYRALNKFEGRSSFYTWLYRIAVNTAKNYLQSKERQPPDIDIDIRDAVNVSRVKLQDNTTPDSLLQRDEVRDAVLHVVNTLPDELRISILLREMGGLSYNEIADIMHCPVGTVRSRIFRARAVVDELLKTI